MKIELSGHDNESEVESPNDANFMAVRTLHFHSTSYTDMGNSMRLRAMPVC